MSEDIDSGDLVFGECEEPARILAGLRDQCIVSQLVAAGYEACRVGEEGGFVALASLGDGRKVGSISLQQEALQGDGGDVLLERAVLKRHDAIDPDIEGGEG